MPDPNSRNTDGYIEPTLADEMGVYFESALDGLTLGQASRVLDALSENPQASRDLRLLRRELSPGANAGGAFVGAAGPAVLPGGGLTLAGRGAEAGLRQAGRVSATAATGARALRAGLSNRSALADVFRSADNALTFGMLQTGLSGGSLSETLGSGVRGAVLGAGGAVGGRVAQNAMMPLFARNTSPGVRAAAVREIDAIPIPQVGRAEIPDMVRTDDEAISRLATFAKNSPDFDRRLSAARTNLSAAAADASEALDSLGGQLALARKRRPSKAKTADIQALELNIQNARAALSGAEMRRDHIDRVMETARLMQATGIDSVENLARAGLRVPSGRVQREAADLMLDPPSYQQARAQLPQLDQQALDVARPAAQRAGSAVALLPRLGVQGAAGQEAEERRLYDLRVDRGFRRNEANAARQAELDRQRQALNLNLAARSVGRDALQTIDRYRHPGEQPLVSRFDAWLRNIPAAERDARFGDRSHGDYQLRALTAFLADNPQTRQRDLETIQGAIDWQGRRGQRNSDSLMEVFDMVERHRGGGQ